MFKFEVLHQDKKARVGKLTTPHGQVNTPVYLPVGTQASVKALGQDDLIAMNSEMILANTYHLYLRPGPETMAKLGGLHEFMNWNRPILTDSGGFQVFSLGFGIEHQVGKVVDFFGDDMVLGQSAPVDPKELVLRTKLCKIEEEGPTFQSHIDGTVHFFPPEKSMEVQAKLGADFVLALDECTSPLHDYDYTKTSMGRTHRWAMRSLKEHKRLKSLNQRMFGVIQGGPFEDLRIESAKFISDADFFGVGIGGALGSKQKMIEILSWMAPHLDPAKPRHMLGIGTVNEIFNCVEWGVDIFDCVYATRIARSALILTENTKAHPADKEVADNYQVQQHFFDIAKVIFKEDARPIEKGCTCYTCQTHSRAYVYHLFRAHELLAYRLASIHNVHFMLRLMEKIREAISEKRFDRLKQEWVKLP